MALKIVRRSPLPLRTKKIQQRIRKGKFGALDAVTDPDLTQAVRIDTEVSCLNAGG